MLEPLQPPEPQHQAWSSKDVFTGKEGMFLEKDAGCVAELGIDIEELRNGNVEISRFMGSVSDQRTTIADLPGIQFASDTFVLKMVFIDRKGFQQLDAPLADNVWLANHAPNLKYPPQNSVS